jgi:hypothetical protein
MSEAGFWARLLLAVLATWRVTHLLANEDGPADLLARLRVRLGTRPIGKLMDCFHCLSFWVAAPMAFLIAATPGDLLMAWLALSGAVCLLERLGQAPVVMESTAPDREGRGSDGMLWPETRHAEEFANTRGETGSTSRGETGSTSPPGTDPRTQVT